MIARNGWVICPRPVRVVLPIPPRFGTAAPVNKMRDMPSKGMPETLVNREEPPWFGHLYGAVSLSLRLSPLQL
jgi:hypothetical protein